MTSICFHSPNQSRRQVYAFNSTSEPSAKPARIADPRGRLNRTTCCNGITNSPVKPVSIQESNSNSVAETGSRKRIRSRARPELSTKPVTLCQLRFGQSHGGRPEVQMFGDRD